ncbi:predicted protein [Uncinocarpus reesii 1704]|uniref:Protection of telomeres protein 1 n=1 Tax=Uncinocarpus reesii (strain UAMH 1704) TaxID=336963 RepID=C4JXT4_UNCRE|nr:uncharacterized protein UREG_07872 [Uncinocarpus reesii 1704]EEP83007.1 predicted protein [Uncinocarpus reesii 1704]
MAVELPPGLLDIPTAKSMNRGTVNVIGLVVDSLPPKRSGGSSFVTTFTLKTSDFASDYWYGLKIRYFHDKQEFLPVPKVGEIALLRNLSLSQFNGATIGLSSSQSPAPWIVFEQDSRQGSGLSTRCSPSNKVPSPAEAAYARYLLTLYAEGRPTAIAATSSPCINVRGTVSTPGRRHSSLAKPDKFKLVKDVDYHSFVDIVGQAVKTFSEYEKFIIYVTDYTRNDNLFDYSLSNGDGRDGDEFSYTSHTKRQWRGPYGRMTLQVTLWEPHSGFARNNVKEDDYVLLRNVHIKLGRSSGVMEGALHTDRQFPSKIDVSLIDGSEPDERVKKLVQRKLEYWKQLKRSLAKEGKHQLPDGEDTGRKSKKNKGHTKNNKPQTGNHRTENIKPSVRPKRDELNPHIRSNYLATPTRTIQQILENETHWNTGPEGIEYQLPFQNLKYRASVRVVDFFPPNLEDFAVAYNSEYDMLDDAPESSDLSDSGGDFTDRRRRWEWRFCLLVEDAGPGILHAPGRKRERLKLFVTGPDAVFLLSIDAVNLRKNPRVLAELREKLFILWGDLEERKTSNPEAFNSNDNSSINAKPFACCIKEYGVRVASRSELGGNGAGEESSSKGFGWERRFRMFDTRIM